MQVIQCGESPYLVKTSNSPWKVYPDESRCLFIDPNITQALVIERADEILNSVGIMPNLAGFTYLRTAMLLAVEQKTPFFQITKLYQAIAKQYGVRATSVEHAIRYAIESAYGADPERIQRVLRYHVAKPSNSEMIAQAVDILRIQLMREGIIKY